MSGSFGSLQLYNIIIVFFLTVVGFLFATVSYHRAFKINTVIVNHIEKYEGYNHLAQTDINRDLITVAYQRLGGQSADCPSRPFDGELKAPSSTHRYCVYESELQTLEVSGYGPESEYPMYYRQYTVITYLTLDLPIVRGLIQLPIVGKTNKVVCFEGGCGS